MNVFGEGSIKFSDFLEGFMNESLLIVFKCGCILGFLMLFGVLNILCFVL